MSLSVAWLGRSSVASLLLVLLGVITAPSRLLAGEAVAYADHPKALMFVEAMVDKGMDRTFVTDLVFDAKHQASIIKAISRPAEKRLNWGEYRKIFLGQKRIDQGVEFWDKHQTTLQRASDIYGVPPEVIVAIIGVETRYGRHAGNYRVIDALATLAFDYEPRSKFFTGQLEQLLQLLQEQSLDAKQLKGSYAGAMGYGQFIPSSYRSFAVDFDRDGTTDILTNPVDAIGSVANYFNSHGWKSGLPVTTPLALASPVEESKLSSKLKPVETVAHWRNLGLTAELDLPNEARATAMRLQTASGDEHWLGLQNFYVITRYNHSRLYAMAVHQLSQAIREKRGGQG